MFDKNCKNYLKLNTNPGIANVFTNRRFVLMHYIIKTDYFTKQIFYIVFRTISIFRDMKQEFTNQSETVHFLHLHFLFGCQYYDNRTAHNKHSFMNILKSVC